MRIISQKVHLPLLCLNHVTFHVGGWAAQLSGNWSAVPHPSPSLPSQVLINVSSEGCDEA